MLTDLPPEIIGLISYHIVLDTGAPPAALLATSHHIHAAASPTPELYARVFRDHYDSSAAVRRLGPLKSRDFGAELRTRTAAFARLNAGEVQARDLWVVYVMLLENDGKNIRHLTRPLAPGPGTDMVALINSFHARTLASRGTYPPERVEDALAMWIAWLLDDHSTRTQASLRALRPYVFAAHNYELFFAPWTLLNVPTPLRRPYAPGPFVVDTNPQPRANVVSLYGRQVTLAHPPLTHAAMLRFFAGPQDGDVPSSATSNSTPTDTAFDTGATSDLRAFPRPVNLSPAHDADFARLQACPDGRKSAGRPILAWRGVFAGCWEGTFTFLDFDAFRDMLRGEGGTQPVYSGAYGEQAQVWKLRETFVRLKTGAAGGSGSAAAATAGGSSSSSSSSGPRNALPLRGPMTNAGFPTTLRDFNLASIASRPPGVSPEDATINDAVGRQLEALDDYEPVPEDEVDAALAADTPDLALLVTGVGHSAWGRFIISGHVRVWDGLCYLVKEYAPDQRGKWIYRGYVTNDDIMVGRWRDTFTHDDYVGYEGTFILSRR